MIRTVEMLPALYDSDETAWLEAKSALARDGRSEDLDLPNLAGSPSEMARWDRRDVECRLVVLLAQLLKRAHRPDRRSRSWRATAIEPRQELNRLAGRGFLRRHASAVLTEVLPEAVERAAAETGLSPESSPAECPSTLDLLLRIELPEEEV